MAKKKRTAKQLAADKARSEKMKQRLSQNQNTETFNQPPPEEDLRSLVEELQNRLNNLSQQQGPQLTSRGIVGTIDRYLMDPANYPDPRPRLQEEPRLKRFAFGDNYELTWEVVPTRYQTIDGVWQQEPKFTLELIGVAYDPDTGERTNRRYTITRGIFFEDPEAAIVVARDNGLEVDETNQKQFLDEMRYLRFRNWLMEAFFPPISSAPKKDKKEMVIGNKLVETWEVSSESSERIDFGSLKNKL